MSVHPRSRLIVVHLAALGAIGVPAAAHAENTCGPGQVVVDAEGHCCSPGQTWDATTGVCATTPTTTPPPVAPPTTTEVTTMNVVMPGAPLGDPNAPVPVTFAPQQPGDVESVRIQSITGATSTCNLPCLMSIAPGYVTITGSGQRSFETAMNVSPFYPIAIQINHLDSPAPLFVTGAAFLALGVAGIIGGSYLLFGQPSCGTPMTAAEEAAFASCNSSNDSAGLGGGFMLGLGAASAITGAIILSVAAHRGTHPVTLMSPGQLSNRPLSMNDAAVHFAGLEPVAIPGGALFRGAISF